LKKNSVTARWINVNGAITKNIYIIVKIPVKSDAHATLGSAVKNEKAEIRTVRIPSTRVKPTREAVSA